MLRLRMKLQISAVISVAENGDQIWSAWKISGMSGISGMPEYQTISGTDRGCLSEVWKGYRNPENKEGTPVLWMRE